MICSVSGVGRQFKLAEIYSRAVFPVSFRILVHCLRVRGRSPQGSHLGAKRTLGRQEALGDRGSVYQIIAVFRTGSRLFLIRQFILDSQGLLQRCL